MSKVAVTTIGSLRDMLVRTIDDLRSDRIDCHKATAITKLVAQVNASLLAEVEIARLNLQANLPLAHLGAMPIGAPDGAPPVTIEAAPAPAPSKEAVALTDAFNSMRVSSRARVTDHRLTGPVDLGEPAPGRSALDQKRAASPSLSNSTAMRAQGEI